MRVLRTYIEKKVSSGPMGGQLGAAGCTGCAKCCLGGFRKWLGKKVMSRFRAGRLVVARMRPGSMAAA